MHRRLVLVRHAKSDYPSATSDHDRPLAARGERDAPAIGEWLGGAVVDPGKGVALVSSATRTQQTWSLAQSRLPSPWQLVAVRQEPRIYESSVGGLLSLVHEQPDDCQTLVLVGHNPAMAGLLEYLALPDDLAALSVDRVRTSSTAVLDVPGPWPDVEPSLRLTAFTVARG